MANNNNELTVQPKKRGRKPKSLTNLKNCTSDQNGILKYFNEKGKQQNEAQDSSAPKEGEKTKNDDLQDSQATKKSTRLSERRKSNTIKTIDFPEKDNLNKIQSSDIKKRGRPTSGKQRVIKVNLARNLCKRKYTSFRKLTKTEIKNSNTRKIPKERLNNVLEIIDNEDHPIWEEHNTSCNQSIHRFWESPTLIISDQNLKLKYARQFLLRRDWSSLAKILCLSGLNTKMYYPLLSKYATILLAHTDKDQFNIFVQFLINMTDSEAVIKKCTKFPTDN